MKLIILLQLILHNIKCEIRSNEFKSISKNYLIYFGGLLLVGIINFVSIPAIVRLYGTDVYGEFSLIQNVILITIAFASGWLNQCIIRFNENKSAFVSLIYILLFIALVPSFLILFGYLIYGKSNLLVYILSSLTLILGSIFAVEISFYQSNFNSKKYVFINLVRVVAFVLFLFILFFTKSGDSIIIALFISYVSPVLFLFAWNKHKDFKVLKIDRAKSLLKQNITDVKKYLGFGVPLTFWFLASSLIGVFSRYVMDYYLSISDVGYYSALYDMTNKGCQLLYTPFLSAGYPLICKLNNEGKKNESLTVIRNLVLLEVLLFIITSICLFYLSDFYVSKIIGLNIYNYTRELVFVIFLSSFLWQLAMIIHKPLELNLKTTTMLILVIASLIVNIILALIYIPVYGMIAGAYSTLAGVVLYISLVTLFAREKYNYSIDS